MQKRQIEAAGGGRRWQGSPMMNAPQGSILAARAPAKARAAALSMNNPTAARIVETWLGALAGKGWQVLSQHPDPATRRALDNEFEGQILALLPVAVRALVRDGEAFVRTFAVSGDPAEDRRAAFGSLALPADQIDPSLTRDLGDGGHMWPGWSLTQATGSSPITFCPMPPEPRSG